MSLYDNILERVKFIAGGIQERKSKPPIAYLNDGRGMTSQTSGGELIASAYGTVFACLQLRANGLMSVDMKSYRELNWQKEELANSHWINRLMSNPNPYFTYSQIFKSIQNWYDINGNAFVWTPKLGYEYPLQMWVLNPTRVRVIRGGDDFIKEYRYQSANDGVFTMPAEEVIHFSNLFPASAKPDEMIGMNIFGKGIVSSVLPYANIDQEVSAFLTRLFQNDAVPPIIATSAENVDGELWNSLKEQWNEALPNFRLRALLDGGLQLTMPPESQIGISFDSVSRDVRSQIAQVFGVPTGMLTGEFQNRATAEVQYAVFRQQTIDPVAIYMAEEFTRHFRRFEDDVLIQAQPYEFADVDSQIKQEEFELKYGIKTINDARRDRGYDTIQGGDVPMLVNGVVPISTVVSMPEPVSVQPRALQGAKTSIVPRSFPMETADAKAESWRQYDEMAKSISSGIAQTMKTFVQEFEKETFESLKEETGLSSAIGMTSEQQQRLQKNINGAIENVTNKVFKDFGMGKEDLSGELGQQLQQMTRDLNANIVSTVNDSMMLIKEDVVETIAQNATQPKEVLEEILQREFKTLSSSRVAMIAQTTATSVTTGTQKNVFTSLGVKSMWNTQRDGNVRPAHKAMDGQVQNELGWFKFGDGSLIDRPAGSSQGGTTVKASNIVRCRCYLFPVKNK